MRRRSRYSRVRSLAERRSRDLESQGAEKTHVQSRPPLTSSFFTYGGQPEPVLVELTANMPIPDHFETELTKVLGIRYPIMCAGMVRHSP